MNSSSSVTVSGIFPSLLHLSTTISFSTSKPAHSSIIRLASSNQVVVQRRHSYACDEPSTLDRLESYWLQEIHQLEIEKQVPLILAGCKLDLRDEDDLSLDVVMSPIMQKFRRIETCIECSAATQLQVFFYAQKAVLHPTAPLYDQEILSLSSRTGRFDSRNRKGGVSIKEEVEVDAERESFSGELSAVESRDEVSFDGKPMPVLPGDDAQNFCCKPG